MYTTVFLSYLLTDNPEYQRLKQCFAQFTANSGLL